MDDDLSDTGGATAREALLARTMAALADGDGAAIVTLREHFGADLARSVRSVASSRNARLNADEVEELVLEVALALAALAGSWDASFGVPPWVWARHRVAAVVDRHLGQWTRPVELVDRAELDRPAPAASSGQEPSVLVVIQQLAVEDPSVALVWDALVAVASPRDRSLFLEVLVQTSLGDRAAAATVARLAGLKPEAVRQQASRIRRRLRDLAATDPRYAGLAELAIVA